MKDVPPLRDRAPQKGTLVTFSDPIHYSNAWALQQQFHLERVEDRRPDTLMLLEHQPVYTLGRRTALPHLLGGEAALRATGAAVESVNRGGSVTYHGPGQLVGYPILKLSLFASGPKEYVWLLEEALLRALASWGIGAYRVVGKPGLFVGLPPEAAKIASIGVRVDRGVTLHGFALNVDLDLAPFSYIVPCGLEGYRVTSVATLLQSSVSIMLVARQVAEQFGHLFNLTWDESFLHLSEKRTVTHACPPHNDELLTEQVADA